MADSPNLAMTFLEQSQSQKHVTVNAALRTLDAVVHLSVIDRDLATPPGSPVDGARYIVAVSGTDEWLGSDGKIAAWQDGAWMIYNPQDGWLCYVEDEGIYLKYEGGWVINDSTRYQTENGTFTGFKVVEEELSTLSGATATTTIAFPNQSIVLGASVRVTTGITGATSFDVGDGTVVNRFGGSIGISVGQTNQGLVGPAGNYALTNVVLTANGGNFTGGAVRVALHYIETSAPTK